MFTKKAFSMVEVMVAIGLFGLAVLPLIWVSTSQTKNAYSASKHMMAGQLAASFMDNILKRPFDDLKEYHFDKPKSVLEYFPEDIFPDEKLFDLKELIDGLEENPDYGKFSAKDNMNSSFKKFLYSINIKKDETNNVARIDVEVFYYVIDGKDNTKQSVKLSALKYGEKNG